jgi:exoribonuclease R
MLHAPLLCLIEYTFFHHPLKNATSLFPLDILSILTSPPFSKLEKILQAAEAAAPKAKRVPLKELAQGAEFTGKVKGIKEFGVFVDFGAESDGLVHISQMSAGFVSNPTDIAKMGDTVSPLVLLLLSFVSSL